MSANRVILEVLKFSSASDILVSLSCVSGDWAKLANCGEVWFALLNTETSVSSLPAKQQFRLVHTCFLPIVSSNALLKFTVLSRSWQSVRLSEPVSINRFASIVLTIDREVFVTGTSRVPDTYRISPSSGLVSLLAPLLMHRGNMAVIRYQANIYAFAGFRNGQSTSAAEVYMYGRQQWRQLLSCFRSRAALNAAENQGEIYLVGGCEASTVECFNTTTETYRLLSFTLTNELPTVSFFRESELIAVQRTGCYRWERGREEWTYTGFPCKLGLGLWSNTPVVLLEGSCYFYQLIYDRVTGIHLEDLTHREFPVPFTD